MHVCAYICACVSLCVCVRVCVCLSKYGNKYDMINLGMHICLTNQRILSTHPCIV